MKLDTSRIAPGDYSFHLGGTATGVKITLVPGERRSAAALLGEFVTGLGNKGLIENLRQSELNAYFGLGSRNTLMRQEPLHDETLKLQLMVFAHPATRPTSFKPPRAWDHEIDNWGILLAQGTQMQLRYPAFGGICFEWDAGNIIRKPSIFFNFRDYDQPWRDYQARSNEAVVEQFRDKTGLEPPTIREMILYAALIGRPDTGPAIDMPSRKWMRMIAEQRSDDGWVNASPGHGATMYPDLRFMEAIAVPVVVAKPGKYEIQVTGVFRYSDRQPRSQPSWEEILKPYKQVVKDARRPMYWELQVDDKSVGKLAPTATTEAEVPVETLPFYVKEKPRSIKEEVVSELSDTVELTKGRRLIRLVFQNMVDGELRGLVIDWP